MPSFVGAISCQFFFAVNFTFRISRLSKRSPRNICFATVNAAPTMQRSMSHQGIEMHILFSPAFDVLHFNNQNSCHVKTRKTRSDPSSSTHPVQPIRLSKNFNEQDCKGTRSFQGLLVFFLRVRMGFLEVCPLCFRVMRTMKPKSA